MLHKYPNLQLYNLVELQRYPNICPTHRCIHTLQRSSDVGMQIVLVREIKVNNVNMHAKLYDTVDGCKFAMISSGRTLWPEIYLIPHE